MTQRLRRAAAALAPTDTRFSADVSDMRSALACFALLLTGSSALAIDEADRSAAA